MFHAIASIRRSFHKLMSVLFRSKVERELERELHSHVRIIEDELIARGMAPEQAHAAARQAIGGLEQTKELHREVRSFLFLEQTRQDVRYGLRSLAKNRGLTVTIVLTLTIAIGATTALFGQINAVFWRKLPVQRPDELRTLVWTSKNPRFMVGQAFAGPDTANGKTFGSYSYPAYLAMRQETSGSFSDLACWLDQGEARPVVITETGLASVQFVSGNYFRTLGVPALLGRTIEADDEQGGTSAGVGILSYRYWQRAFHGDPSVLNRKLRLNGTPFTVVGVAPEEFYGLDAAILPDVIVPITMLPIASPFGPTVLRNTTDWTVCRVVGRLRSGRNEEQARIEAQNAVQQSITSVPVRFEYELPNVSIIPPDHGVDTLRTATSSTLFILTAVVGVILLIACANIAGLLIARGTSRHREFATRIALGASRERLVRQLLTETILLSAAGGLAGFSLAYVLNRFTLTALSLLLPPVSGTTRTLGIAVTPDARVLVLSTAIALLTGIAFGLLPALHTTRVDLLSMMKSSSSAGGMFSIRGGRILVSAQAGMAMFLLLGAGLFVRTVMNLRAADLGYQPDGLLYMRVEPRLAGINTTEKRAAFFEAAMKHLESTSGVRSVSASVFPMLGGFRVTVGDGGGGFRACTTYLNPDPGQVSVRNDLVGPQYFATIGLPLRAGRDFEWSDAPYVGPRRPAVAIVNESFVKTFFPAGTNPLGQKVVVANQCPLDLDQRPAADVGATIIGVVADSRILPRTESGPTVYRFFAGPASPLTLIIRTKDRPDAALSSIRRSMLEFNSNVPVFGEITPLELRDLNIRKERLLSTLLVAFSAFALILCCLGIYGLLTYAVGKRTKEIGIRTALGAKRRDVMLMVLREFLGPVLIGISAGTAAAFAATRYVQSLLFGMSRPDALAIGVALLLLVTVAVLAAAIPARHASRIDPLKALRYE